MTHTEAVYHKRLAVAGMALASLLCSLPAHARPVFGPGDSGPSGLDIPVWARVLIALVVLAGLAALIGLASGMRGKPVKRISIGNSSVELWVRERRIPTRAGAIIVPVAPDLRLVNGIAKWVRDCTAGKLQWQALQTAPLDPGKAFVGIGGKYRFGAAALAVVMDSQKRTRPEWISGAIADALRQLHDKGVKVCLLPDMTEDLLRHPRWITDDQRRETCGPIARAMLQAIAEQNGAMPTVRIWVWRKANRQVWEEELERWAESGKRQPARAAAS